LFLPSGGLYDADTLAAAGVPYRAILDAGYGSPSETVMRRQEREGLPHPADLFAALAGPIVEPAIILGVYAAATAALGPLGFALAALGRRKVLERDARAAAEARRSVSPAAVAGRQRRDAENIDRMWAQVEMQQAALRERARQRAIG
jgi:hypothetical protein